VQLWCRHYDAAIDIKLTVWNNKLPLCLCPDVLQGWIATRWIPGGVGVYMGFLLMAPRLHSLGKSRGYVTISEFIFDRYLPPSGANWVGTGSSTGSSS
jgi:hypothetical protein